MESCQKTIERSMMMRGTETERVFVIVSIYSKCFLLQFKYLAHNFPVFFPLDYPPLQFLVFHNFFPLVHNARLGLGVWSESVTVIFSPIDETVSSYLLFYFVCIELISYILNLNVTIHSIHLLFFCYFIFSIFVHVYQLMNAHDQILHSMLLCGIYTLEWLSVVCNPVHCLMLCNHNFFFWPVVPLLPLIINCCNLRLV